MHIVSAKPQFVSKNDIPAETIENERRIEAGKQDLADKKPEMREKIVQGRIDKLFAERCLNEQQFVKDPTQSVSKFLAARFCRPGRQTGSEELLALYPGRKPKLSRTEKATSSKYLALKLMKAASNEAAFRLLKPSFPSLHRLRN